MTRCAAFLRGVNAGGHVVAMAQLRRLFEELGFEDVSTVINSGNVLFTSEDGDGADLERRIETHLREPLGYEATTFVRTAAEVGRIADHQPFPSPPAEGTALHISFLRRPLAAAVRRDVLALATPEDELAVKDREVYWLRHGRLMDATLDGKALAKLLGPTTMRTANTVQRVAAKLAC